MFGSVGAWYYSTLAGIQQSIDSLGYQNIVIKVFIIESIEFNELPLFSRTVDVILYSTFSSVNATIETIRGLVESSWLRSGGSICGNTPEGTDLVISCGSAGGVIESVDFASFGTPS